jgi:hypothetical protein
MPIDFDQIQKEEDRSFIIRGETFVIQKVRPEVMDEIDRLEDEYLAIEEPHYSDIVKLADQRIKLMIDDRNGQVERWETLRSREEDPVSYGEVMAISRKALEVISGVPTLPSTPSTTGGATAADSSKDASS